MNVMVDRKAGGPKLFDFNQIPFTERPQNPFIGLALKFGLLGRESRDLRKLTRFKNFDRVERKLLKFYKERQHSRPEACARFSPASASATGRCLRA